MELIDFSKNEDSIAAQSHIESVLLWGNPDVAPESEITICIPTYKRPRLLKEAIESALNQATGIPYRIIVVDNDPDFDNMELLDLVRSFGQEKLLYYKNKENLGLFGNLNRCIILAKTRWVALLHDDDLLLEKYVITMSQILLKQEKNIDGLCNMYKIQNYPFWIKRRRLLLFLRRIYGCIHNIFSFFSSDIIKIDISANFFLGDIYGVPTCGMIFKRKKFIESGGFNVQDYRPSNDWFFMIYYAEKYKLFKLKKPITAIYRWGVNASLKEETRRGFEEDRKLCLQSLKKYSSMCRFWMAVFKKDYDAIMISRFEVSVKNSLLYEIIRRIYGIFTRTCVSSGN
jgi:glycosyltransferase involved in cell wall biosynthesis